MIRIRKRKMITEGRQDETHRGQRPFFLLSANINEQMEA